MTSIFLRTCSLIRTTPSASSPLLSTTFPKSLTMPCWTCSKCTYINPPSQKSTCQICLSSASSSISISSQSQSPSPSKWSCKACTFANTHDKTHCEICGTRATGSLLSTFEALDSLTTDIDSSIGSVFFPLQSQGVSVSQVSEGFRELKQDDDDPVVEVSDAFPETKDVSVLRPCKRKLEEVCNDVSQVVIPSKTSNQEVGVGFGGKTKNQDFALGVFDGFRNVGKANDEKSSRPAQAIMEDVPCDSASITLKILSYNVWFREDLEVDKRMKAIGDLIEQHSPDFICFQEVTVKIYHLFQQSRWWKVYKCSVSPEIAATRPYFCMQLSKIPVKSFNCRPFRNSVMGRELCVAKIEVEEGKPLVVATSHLESPTPAPPKWDQMYSKERVAQAKEAVIFLKDLPNVIFAGDMNWDDKLDGQFPLPDGWIDAWSEVRPRDIGYTYDTKSNEMLTGNRTLQKRLDRFICNFRDFEIRRIEMIGLDAIPGLSYCKTKKVKKEVKQLTLPVLPSDHYGLLLTICKKP